MNLKQVNWKFIFLSTILMTIIMSIYGFLTNQLTLVTFISSALIFPFIGFVFSFSKQKEKIIKGCLLGKTEKMKNDFFESLYKFKDEDPIFLLEQSRDLLDDEFDEFTVWIFDNKYSEKGLMKKGYVISKLTDEQKFYVTLISELNTELIKKQIITPTQKYEIEKYILNRLS